MRCLLLFKLELLQRLAEAFDLVCLHRLAAVAFQPLTGLCHVACVV